MKINWNNLEGMCLTKKGNLRKGCNLFIEMDSCKKCGDPYLTPKQRLSDHCSKSCANSGENNPNYGKKFPDMSESQRGKNNHMYGKKHTEKTKQKMRESSQRLSGENNGMYGKKHTEESRKKMRICNKGENNPMYGISRYAEDNPNWKGGISCEPYCYEWSFKEFKDFIKERDDNRCLNPDCWGNIYRLSVHHVDYNKKNCEPENLITLCTSCNARANFNREWHKEWYEAIIFKRYGAINE